MRLRPLHLAAAGGLAVLLLAGLVVLLAATTNHGTGAGADLEQGLAEASRRELDRLPYCAVARTYGVSPEVLAGVVLAEKQLNRDWSDAVQDGLFAGLLALRSDEDWQRWADESLALAQRSMEARARSREWPRAVAWTGIVFSLGPAQITPRTALRACREAAAPPAWCASPRRVVEALMDESGSLEVAALVLAEERRRHLAETQVDVGGSPGRWATLYNFGGEIFRARFGDRPDRPANGFGQWVERNSAGITARLRCER